MTAAAVSPIDTPIAVTIPGHTRHNSMMGIMVKAMLFGSRGPSVLRSMVSPSAAAFSAAIRLANDERCISLIPKVLNSFRSKS
ncbi:unannotated protein [freshwater metagenome]|uniref:Unannotated protein n=1 Tax=freshwater metagenome TaxID=449393 RepID=A0A6J7UNS1_9ZZZZ